MKENLFSSLLARLVLRKGVTLLLSILFLAIAIALDFSPFTYLLLLIFCIFYLIRKQLNLCYEEVFSTKYLMFQLFYKPLIFNFKTVKTMMKKFPLLLSVLLLGSLSSFATDYILKNATADASGTFLASNKDNWTIDGSTSLTDSVPGLSATDNVTIPAGVVIAWDLAGKRVGTITINGTLRFGNASAANGLIVYTTPGTTVANTTLNISALAGSGNIYSHTQSFGLRIVVADANVTFSGTIVGNALGGNATASIKLTQDLNIQGPHFLSPASSSIMNLTTITNASGSDSLVLGTAASASLRLGALVTGTGIPVGSFVKFFSADRKLVVLTRKTTAAVTAAAATNFYVDLNGHQLTLNGGLNSGNGVFFKGSGASKLIVNTPVATILSFADSSSLDALTINSVAAVTLNANFLTIGDLDLQASALTIAAGPNNNVFGSRIAITRSIVRNGAGTGFINSGVNSEISFKNDNLIVLPPAVFGISTTAAQADTTNFRRLVLDGPGGVVLSQPTKIITGMVLTRGIVFATDGAPLILPSGVAGSGTAQGFVDGPIIKSVGNASAGFVLPTGYGSVQGGVYQPVTIINSAGGTFTAQAFPGPHVRRKNVAAPLQVVTGGEYYYIKATSPVKFSVLYAYPAGTLVDSADLQIATLNGTTWEKLGGSAVVAGSNLVGKISSDVEVSEGFYAVASTNAASVLPVQFSNVKAVSNGANTVVSFSAQQVNVASFVVERSADGKNFVALATLAAGANSYTYTDAAVSGVVYYRIKAVDNDGAIAYSKVVATQGNAAARISVYPSPAKTFVQVKTAATKLKVYNAIGVVVAVPTVKVSDNVQQISISTLPAGIYYIDADGAKASFIKN